MDNPLFADVEEISAWMDRMRPPSPTETPFRILKLMEESGEVVRAYIGVVGQNPRKGITHARDDLLNELADVALTALCAMQHLVQDIDRVHAIVEAKARHVVERIPEEQR